MNRRVLVLGSLAGLVTMVLAWFLFDAGPQRDKAKPRKPRVANIATPIRMRPDELARVSPNAAFAPGVKDKLYPRAALTAPPAPPSETAYPTDQSGITAAVAAVQGDLQGCYDTAKLHAPGLLSDLTLVLAVAPAPGGSDGRVESIHVDAEVDASVFAGCAVTAFQAVRFATVEPMTLRYPIRFPVGQSTGGTP